MHFSTAVVALASAVVVSAANHQVLVGDGGLTFTPPSITAASDDTVTFEFRAKNHSVTQSTFPAPCTPKPDGANSGFQFTPEGTTQFLSWSFTVDDPTIPLWFFCAQTNPINHCQSGMVFAVNAPPDKTFETFQNAAKGSTPGSAPAASGAVSSVPGTIITNFPSSTLGGSPSSTFGGSFPTGSGFSTSVISSLAPTSAGSTDTAATATSTDGAANNNGALQLAGSATNLLAIVGLVAGLML